MWASKFKLQLTKAISKFESKVARVNFISFNITFPRPKSIPKPRDQNTWFSNITRETEKQLRKVICTVKYKLCVSSILVLSWPKTMTAKWDNLKCSTNNCHTNGFTARTRRAGPFTWRWSWSGLVIPRKQGSHKFHAPCSWHSLDASKSFSCLRILCDLFRWSFTIYMVLHFQMFSWNTTSGFWKVPFISFQLYWLRKEICKDFNGIDSFTWQFSRIYIWSGWSGWGWGTKITLSSNFLSTLIAVIFFNRWKI